MWFKIYTGLCSALFILEFVPEYAAVPSPFITTCFWMMNILGVMTIVFSAAVFFAQALESEYQRSEALLDNILPKTVAKRIKAGENPVIDKHSKISLLFADIVGFTKLSLTVNPWELVSKLNDLFSRFDKISVDLKVEKIK